MAKSKKIEGVINDAVGGKGKRKDAFSNSSSDWNLPDAVLLKRSTQITY